MSKIGFAALGFSFVTAMLTGQAANAVNLVQNGDFSAIQSGYPGTAAESLATYGSAGLSAPNWGGGSNDAAVQGWSITPGISAVFASDALTNPAQYGVAGSYNGYQMSASWLLYTNGLGIDPNGGNFVGLDGDQYGGLLYQTISGLTAGKSYDLTFYQASDHYQYYGDLQTSTFVVSLGNESYLAETMAPTTSTPVPWTKVAMKFTATSALEVLSFKNIGVGAPPFALLDGVSLTEVGAVPEPSSWALLIVGFGAVGGVMRHSRRRSALAA